MKKHPILFLLIILQFSFIRSQNIDLPISARVDTTEVSNFSKIELLTKNDTITFLITKNEYKKPKPVIVFLQGSLPIPIIQSHQKTIFPFEIKPYLDLYHFVIIARKGVPIQGDYNENDKILDEYHQNNNLYYRVNQANEVVNYLRKQTFIDKNKIYVIGHSEGYRVASKLAEKNKKISKLVCMSANPFNRNTEAILKNQIAQFTSDNDSISQKNIASLIKDFQSIGNDISVYKNKIEIYNWASYEVELPLNSFKKINKPLLVVYGTNDIGASQNYLLPFLLTNKNITLKAYPNYGHNFEQIIYDSHKKPIETTYHWDAVFKDVSDWLLLSKAFSNKK